ncbi:alpha/beta fold hydrolase [Roseomonas sp. OT10]|uniref:alpha/beta hydrolase family protein n=1 Tax=Roseomonas cutis TaxID=2897332 RepID=UPI001E28D73F|nr:alpha/beta fold hydrolase [Roseomonas sp. OT10]UFN47399.1 alpha/beta fold hydrolase [Roseomonas sp. OT10]
MTRREALRLAATALTPAASPSEGPLERADEPMVVTGAGGVPLAGSLRLPAGPGPVPALLLVQGSGPTDRDGSQPPHDAGALLRLLAEFLAVRGVASLRLDKRGQHGNAATLPARAEWDRFFAWENTLADAEAAFRALAARPEVEPGRLGLLGHSEGGVVALALAAAGRVRPAHLVLLATTGRPLGEVIEDQLRRLLALQGAPPEVAEGFLAEDRRIRAAILATGRVPRDVPPGLRALYQPWLGPFLAPLLALDPAALLRRVPVPVLALSGAEDVQVTAARDAAAIATALAGRGDGSASLVVPGVGHGLKAPGTGPDGPVDPAILERLGTWMADR